MCYVCVEFFKYRQYIVCIVEAHANGRNIVGPNMLRSLAWSHIYIYTLYILYFVLYRNNQIYKKGQSQRLKWLGQHNNNRGLLKEQTGLTNLQN